MTEKQIKKHMKKEHKNSELCDICGKKFGDRATVEKHKVNEHNSDNSNCIESDVDRTDKIEINQKENTESGSESDDYSEYDGDMMQCVDCTDQFKNSFTLINHMKKHHKL